MASATVQVNVRLDPSLYDKVRDEADRDNLTVTAIVNSALQQRYQTKRKGEKA